MAHHRKNINTQLTQNSSQNDALLTAQNSSTTGITALNTKLDSFSGHTNNTITVGDGSTQLRTVPLGYDRTNGKAVSFLVDSAGHQQIDAVDVTAKLDTFAGAGNNNIGEGSSKLQIYNYGRDVANGNYKPMVVNASAEQIVALSSTDNAVLDTIATNTANIKISTDSVNLNVDTLEALIGSSNTKLDTLESSADALISANHTDLVALEASLTSMEAKMDVDNAVFDNILSKNGEIETSLNSILTKNGEIETSLNSILTKNGEIETTSNAIQSALEGSLTVGSHAVTNAGTFAVQDSTVATKLDHLSDNLDTLETTNNAIQSAVEGTLTVGSHAVTNAGTFAVQDSTVATKLDHLSDNLDTLETSLTSMESKQDTQVAHLNDIKSNTGTVDGCVANNKMNVNISSGNISGFATSANQVGILSDLDDINTYTGDTLTAVQDLEASLTSIESKIDADLVFQANILTKNTEIDTAVDAMSAKLPASLGEKANASSISTCRSSTAGAYDLSARTTIGTASTSTKLLCDSDGHLKVDVVSGGISVDNLSTHAKQDTMITHLSNISSHTGTVDGCVASNKMNVNISSDLTERAGFIFNGVAQPSNASSIPVSQNLYFDVSTSTWSSGMSVEGAIITMDTNATRTITGGATSFHAISNGADLTTFRSCMAGLDDPNNIAEVNFATVDRQGHLKVDITGGNISGFSTSAKQDTIIGHLDGVEGKLDHLSDNLDTIETTLTEIATDGNAVQALLTTIDSDTNDIKTAVELSNSKTTLNRTTERSLATNGSHSDYEIDTGTTANFIKFYVNIGTNSVTNGDLYVQMSEASNFANPVIVFEGSDSNILTSEINGVVLKRVVIEIKNCARYVRLLNNNGSSTFDIDNSIIIHGRE